MNGVGVQRLMFCLRTRLAKQLQSLPASFYEQHPVGDLVQRLERDVTVVGEWGSDILPSLIRMAAETIMTLTAMAVLDWHLARIFAPLLPIFVYIRRSYRWKLRRSAEDVRHASGLQSSLLNEILTGIIQIQLLGAERRILRRYARLNLVTMKSRIRQQKTETLYGLLEMSVVAIATSVIIGYGGLRVVAGTMSAGTLVAFYGYIGNIFSPMHSAVELYARMHRVRASVCRLIDIERQPNTIQSDSDAVSLDQAPSVLTCRNVKLDYGPDKPALRSISFAASAGERLAIVGESGAGKSSLLKLIPRLYDPNEGTVAINGQDLRRLHLNTVRHAISFVPQDPILFQGTLRDNLLHASPAATADEIASAAWIACFTEVVERLPGGWETELGPMGVGLSGGERQRLAITRALLQRRPVLILDEATSALDPPMEGRLLSRLESYCAGRILICAGHRLSHAQWANRVLVMRSGLVVENGTHEELLRPGTQYYMLWHRDHLAGERSDSGHPRATVNV